MPSIMDRKTRISAEETPSAESASVPDSSFFRAQRISLTLEMVSVLFDAAVDPQGEASAWNTSAKRVRETDASGAVLVRLNYRKGSGPEEQHYFRVGPEMALEICDP